MDRLLESFRAAPVKQEHIYLMHIIQAPLQQNFVIHLSNIIIWDYSNANFLDFYLADLIQ